jgi:cytochrome oxidase Cu insertion factor (SCO1/SenC/PrrC family)
MLVIAAGLVVAEAVAFAMTGLRPHRAQPIAPQVAGIPATLPTSLVNLMALTPVPDQAAPGFTLTDQAGHTLSLASLKGHAVVLECTDPHCTDVCPIVSREFVDADHGLGSAASHVAFIAVNVNGYHHGVADVGPARAAHVRPDLDGHVADPDRDLGVRDAEPVGGARAD